MAQIPVFTQRHVNISGGGRTQFVDASGLVKGMEIAAGAIANRHERLRRTDEQMLAIGLDDKFAEMRANTLSFKGKNAMGLTKQLQAEEGSLREEFMADIKDPLTKENAQVMFQKQFEQQVQWTQDYELKQEDVYMAQADEIARTNLGKKLNGTEVGETDAIDGAAVLATGLAWLREGEERWSQETADIYKQRVRDQYYAEQISRWYTEDPDLAYAWFEENKEAMKLKVSPKVYDAIAAAHKANYQIAETMRVYKEVRKDYGDNYRQAAFDIMDPANFEKYGIKEHDYKTAHQVSSWMQSQGSMNDSLNKQKKMNQADADTKAYNERTAAIAAIKDVDARNAAWQNLRNDIRTNKSIEQADREKMIDSIDKANYEEDPKQVRTVKNLIDSGDITRNAQIHAWLGDGIGNSTTELEAYLKSKKAADKLGDGENYMKRLRKVYMTAAVERAPAKHRQKGKRVLMKSDVELFMFRLEAERRAADLPVSHPDLIKMGMDLMDKGSQWYEEDDGKEEKIDEPLWAWKEYQKFRFMEDPSSEVAIEMQFMKDQAGGGPVMGKKTEDRTDEIAKPIGKIIDAKQSFKTKLMNPVIIGAGSIEEAADILQGEWEAINGRGMNDEERQQLEDTLKTRWE